MKCACFALLWMLLASFARAAGPVSPAEFTAAYEAITAAKGQTNDAARLHQLFDLDWRYQMIESPETATYVGYAGQNARWGDSSRAAIERRKAELTRPLRVAGRVRPGFPSRHGSRWLKSVLAPAPRLGKHRWYPTTRFHAPGPQCYLRP